MATIWLPCCANGPTTGGPDQAQVHYPDGGTQDGAVAVPRWRWESPVPQGNNLRGLFGIAGQDPSQDELFAVGENGTFLHYAGGSFAIEPAPDQDTTAMLAVGASGAGSQAEVLAVGFGDTIYARQGSAWVLDRSSGGIGDLTGLWGSATPGEFYVVGTTGRVYHVQGDNWQPEAQGLVSQYLSGAWGSGTGANQEVYAVGASGKILHRAGGNWTVEGDGATFQQLNAVCGNAPATDVYAVGANGAVVHRSAGTWAAEQAPVTVNLNAAIVLGQDVFAVGDKGTIVHRSGGAWQAEAAGLTSEILSAVWGSVRGADPTVYAAGNLGTILVRRSGKWAWLSQPATTSPLSAVVATPAHEVYAVGGAGTVLRRSATGSPAAAWSTEAQGLTGESLSSVASDPTGADVYAVGTSGTILHRAQGAWQVEGAILTSQDLSGVWVGADAVFAVGGGGRIVSKSNGRWGLEQGEQGAPVTSAGLLAVWGSGKGSAVVVYAAGADGSVWRRSQGAWAQEMTGVTQPLSQLFGVSADEVYAVGAAGVLHRKSGAWMQDAVPQKGFAVMAACLLPQSGDLYLLGTQGGILVSRAQGWLSDIFLATAQPVSALAAAQDQDLYAVGPGGLILHYH